MIQIIKHLNVFRNQMKYFKTPLSKFHSFYKTSKKFKNGKKNWATWKTSKRTH